MSKRLMVVDDSRLVRVQLEDTLAGTDYVVAAYCRSGEDAIEQYAAVQPDLVTMDIIMIRLNVLRRSGPKALSTSRFTRSSCCMFSNRHSNKRGTGTAQSGQ